MLFVIKGRLHPIWRILLYVPVLAITAGAVVLLCVSALAFTAGMIILPYVSALIATAGVIISLCASVLVVTAGVAILLYARVLLIEVGVSILRPQVALTLLILLGTWVCRRFLDKRDMASLGFGFHCGWLSDAGIGLLLGAGLTGIIFVVEVLNGWIDVQGFAWNFLPFGRVAFGLFTAIIDMAAVAVMEETLIRGYLLQTLEEGFGTPVGVIVSSSVFGLLHLINPSGAGWARYVIPFTITLAGFMLAVAYLVRRSLWLPIALHFSWNLFEYDVFGLIGAPVQSATFFVTEVTGPASWVGLPNSDFGPEVGLLGVLTMSFGTGLLWFLRRRQ